MCFSVVFSKYVFFLKEILYVNEIEYILLKMKEDIKGLDERNIYYS